MKRILVADGNEGIRFGYEIILSDAGYVVLHASSASEAIMVMGVEMIDLLITDIDMPDDKGIDGITLAKTVRATYPLLPILIISGHDELALKTATIQAPVAAIAKPAKLEKVRDIVQELLEQKPS